VKPKVHKRKRALPPLAGWASVYGDGKHSSYTYSTGVWPSRRYSISNVQTASGRHGGYSLTVAPASRGLHGWIGPGGDEMGMPSVQSLYRSPQAAASAANRYEERRLQGSMHRQGEEP
jgi:hypothetical protein